MTLLVVATPIGNLEDITYRALDTLKSVDFIACEDTRQTLKILERFGFKKELVSFHQHSSDQKIAQVLGRLKEGASAALVTDAGTPGISDPGQKLISRAIEQGIGISSIPGPTAFVAALSVSGFDTSSFSFYGFLPHKKGRQKTIQNVLKEEKVVVLYESVHRIKKLLGELTEVAPDREIMVGRELTKKFEEIYRGRPAEVAKKIKEKGEFVIVIDKE